MKYILGLIVLAVVGGGVVVYLNKEEVTPGDNKVLEENTAGESTDVTNQMPAPGITNVPEMIVAEEASDELKPGDDEVETDEITDEAKVFNINGTNFAFNTTEIRVKEGDTVTVNFTSSEGLHDWVIDEFSAATEQVRPGTPTSVTFVADQAGAFEYYCSVGQHRANGMIGTLIVE